MNNVHQQNVNAAKRHPSHTIQLTVTPVFSAGIFQYVKILSVYANGVPLDLLEYITGSLGNPARWSVDVLDKMHHGLVYIATMTCIDYPDEHGWGNYVNDITLKE